MNNFEVNVEHDDYGEPRRKRSSGGSSRTLWYVLGGAGCFCVLICGGVIAFAVWGFKAFTRDLPDIQAASDRYLDAIKSGKLDDAYSMTSAGYRNRTTTDQFAAFVKQFGALSRHQSRSMNGFRVFNGTAGKQATLQMTLHEPGNAMNCTLLLVDENGAWKVDRFTVP